MHPACDCLLRYSFSWSQVIVAELAQVSLPLCSTVWRILLVSVAKVITAVFLYACWRRGQACSSPLRCSFCTSEIEPNDRGGQKYYKLLLVYSVLWEHLPCACLKAYGLKSCAIYGHELGRNVQLCSGTLTGTIGTTCSICYPAGVTQFNGTLTWVLNLAKCFSDSTAPEDGVRDWLPNFRAQ